MDYETSPHPPRPLSAPLIVFLAFLSGTGLLAALWYSVQVGMLIGSIDSVGTIFVFWYGVGCVGLNLFCICGPTFGFTFPWRDTRDRVLRIAFFAASALGVLLPLAVTAAALLLFRFPN